MDNIRIKYLGTNTKHSAGYIADYEKNPYFAFLSFRTPFKAKIDSGEIVNGRTGQSMLVSPYFHQWHTGINNQGFINDWIFFSGGLVEKIITKYKIPLNRVLHTHSTNRFAEILHQIDQERTKQELHWGEHITTLSRQLFILISRECNTHQNSDFTPEKMHAERFQELRNKIQEDLTHPWKNSEMAKMVGLSENHFSAIYKKLYRISPIEDIIQKRLDYAKLLLVNQNLTISEIAHLSGFSNVYYFSRMFKKRNRIPPQQFRRNSA